MIIGQSPLAPCIAFAFFARNVERPLGKTFCLKYPFSVALTVILTVENIS